MQKCAKKFGSESLTLWLLIFVGYAMVTGESVRQRDREKENSTLFTNKYPILPIESSQKKHQEQFQHNIRSDGTKQPQSLHMLGLKNSLIAKSVRTAER